jgi:hypothetical protein
MAVSPGIAYPPLKSADKALLFFIAIDTVDGVHNGRF